jgi:hypothetical protein
MLSKENGKPVNILKFSTDETISKKIENMYQKFVLMEKPSDTNSFNSDELFLKKKTKNEFLCHFYPCTKIYKSRENLDLHIQNYHLNLKPYQCELCEKRFSHRNGKLFVK